ncbi:MAG: NAD(P)-dependent oxidoreductase [Verrucomicrobia bacterium]|nr:MAG: NAD(P)-dependent oxidoreductase [Verrucomicrobiota bacterium]
MNSMDRAPAAILGLGIIGRRASERLIGHGWPVQRWSRTPRGLAYECTSAREAITGAAIISIYLNDGPAVLALVHELLPHLLPEQVVLNHATVDLPTTLEVAKLLEKVGCSFLDAPFTGSKVAAEQGNLFYYAGGNSRVIDAVQPYLALTSRGTLRCGEIGSATLIKLTTNLISACTVQAMSEALGLATHHGVDAAILIDAVAENASASPLTKMKFEQIAREDYAAHFSLNNMWKDSRYMLDLAAAVDLEVPAIAAVSKRMAELCAAGQGELDFASLAKPYQS